MNGINLLCTLNLKCTENYHYNTGGNIESQMIHYKCSVNNPQPVPMNSTKGHAHKNRDKMQITQH